MTRRVRRILFDNVRGKILTNTNARISDTANDGIETEDFADVTLQVSGEAFDYTDEAILSATAIDNRVKYHTGLFNDASTEHGVFTASSNQTSFSSRYSVGHVEVYVNGLKKVPTDFTATDGTTVVLNTPASAGDVIDIIGTTILLSAGSSDFDGGSANSVYITTQNVDAGTSNSQYTESERIDGGIA
jgi:hypothetical protein